MNHLDHMLRAKSVAVVGASERPGTVGDQTIRQLIGGGFDGAVYPVNPGYPAIAGVPAFASVSDIGEPVDLVVLAVANQRLEEELSKAVRAGAKAAAIFASCHGEASDGSRLRDRLALIAAEAGLRICGGNGMGFLNLEDRLRVCGFYQPAGLRPGGITFLTHSGSLFSAMLHNHRGLRFNVVVSTGLEINTTMSNYLDWALDLDSTRVVALFLETVRDPAAFSAALEKAQRADVPVVALKVGRSERARQAVATHSEALAGEEAVYEALFSRHGVHEVETMDEMADTVELFAAGRRAGAGGLGVVHDSGGERALLIDIADRTGVSLPPIDPSTRERVASLIDPGLEAENPVDAWGTGHDATEIFTETLVALGDDPGIGAVAFAVDLTEEEKPDDAYSSAVLATMNRVEKPVVVIANLSTTVDPMQAAHLRDSGVPVLEGTETALRAIRHLFDHGKAPRPPAPAPRITTPQEISLPEDEIEALAVIASYGIAVPEARAADDVLSAVGAADSIGYPVVVKTLGTAHKSDVDGVRLALSHASAVAEAYADISSRLGPKVIVARHAPPGVEVALGMIRDPGFGPVVIIGSGGTLVELLPGRVAQLPPIAVETAAAAIERLPIRSLLAGHRGAAAADVGGLASAIARFSELVLDLPIECIAVDVNPIIVGEAGAVAVDALFSGEPA